MPEAVEGGDQGGEQRQQVEAQVERPPLQPDGGQDAVLAEEAAGQRHPGEAGGTGQEGPEGERERAPQPPIL